MSEQTIAMIFTGFAVVATLVSWAFYAVAGKALWDMRQLFRRTPGDHGKGKLGREHAEEGKPANKR